LSERTRDQWLAHVYARGEQLRSRRRMLAGGAALAVVAAVLLPTVAFSSGGGHAKKLNVASCATSTTIAASDEGGVVQPEPAATTSSTAPATTRPPQGVNKKPLSAPVSTTASPQVSVPPSRTPYPMAFANGGTIEVIDDNGAHGHVIAQGGYLTDPQWSPDGTRVAYEDTEGAGPPNDVYVVNADGTDPHKVAASLAVSSWPAWSPDGKWLAVSGEQTLSSAPEIYVVSADGKTLRALTTGGSNSDASNSDARSTPAWAPDGTRIAFICGGYDICVVGVDGTNLKHLGVASGPTRIGWSRDGTRIAFYGTDGSYDYNIMTVGDDGSDPRVLKAGVLYIGSYDILARPVWSPDGRTLAFDSDQGAAVMGSDGNGFRVLAAGKQHPSWSPDGSRLVVTTSDLTMTVVGLDGSTADSPGVRGSQPQYQPVN